MATSLIINEILSQVKKLDKEEQYVLLQKMAYLLKRNEHKKNKSVSLTSLADTGSDILKF
ncbi:MAG: hypothetical protein M9887_04340 [Chitinophagales bacterium]|nr:hypothetical protein [Chitinophagales bacterium]